MLSEFKSFCLMGVSNSQVVLSEKDLNNDKEFFLVRPVLEFHDDEECQSLPPEDDEVISTKQKVQEEDKDDVSKVPGPLKIKIPSYEGAKESEKDDENGGFKTPTSAASKISEILQCPTAPRKPKSTPSTKRKASRPGFLLDLSKEIEALFATPLVIDLGGKIKKVKQGN